jgi:hypothetical protein
MRIQKKSAAVAELVCLSLAWSDIKEQVSTAGDDGILVCEVINHLSILPAMGQVCILKNIEMMGDSRLPQFDMISDLANRAFGAATELDDLLPGLITNGLAEQNCLFICHSPLTYR